MKYITMFAVCIFCMTMFACQDSNLDEQSNNAVIDYSQQPDQVAMKFEATFLDKGKVVAILQSGRARVYQEAAETLLDSSVYVQFFSKDTGKRMSTLTADSARIDDRTKDMLAFGNVVVLSDSNSMKLTTSILEWHNQKQKVYSSEFVTITSPDRVIQGYGFESDLKLEDYRIHKVSMIDYNY